VRDADGDICPIVDAAAAVDLDTLLGAVDKFAAKCGEQTEAITRLAAVVEMRGAEAV
jgi:hypothetical protein